MNTSNPPERNGNGYKNDARLSVILAGVITTVFIGLTGIIRSGLGEIETAIRAATAQNLAFESKLDRHHDDAMRKLDGIEHELRKHNLERKPPEHPK